MTSNDDDDDLDLDPGDVLDQLGKAVASFVDLAMARLETRLRDAAIQAMANGAAVQVVVTVSPVAIASLHVNREKLFGLAFAEPRPN